VNLSLTKHRFNSYIYPRFDFSSLYPITLRLVLTCMYPKQCSGRLNYICTITELALSSAFSFFCCNYVSYLFRSTCP